MGARAIRLTHGNRGDADGDREALRLLMIDRDNAVQPARTARIALASVLVTGPRPPSRSSGAHLMTGPPGGAAGDDPAATTAPAARPAGGSSAVTLHCTPRDLRDRQQSLRRDPAPGACPHPLGHQFRDDVMVSAPLRRGLPDSCRAISRRAALRVRLRDLAAGTGTPQLPPRRRRAEGCSPGQDLLVPWGNVPQRGSGIAWELPRCPARERTAAPAWAQVPARPAAAVECRSLSLRLGHGPPSKEHIYRTPGQPGPYQRRRLKGTNPQQRIQLPLGSTDAVILINHKRD
jgi:hypothetical protein